MPVNRSGDAAGGWSRRTGRPAGNEILLMEFLQKLGCLCCEHPGKLGLDSVDRDAYSSSPCCGGLQISQWPRQASQEIYLAVQISLTE